MNKKFFAPIQRSTQSPDIPPPPGGGSWRWDGAAWMANVAPAAPISNEIAEPEAPESSASA